MQATPAHKHPQPRCEQIILFRCSSEIFAISSASVQEVRSVDNLSGAETEVTESSVAKVHHALRRGDKNIYVVNAALHFGLRPAPPSLIFLLRNQRVALLVDGIEKMTTMTRLQALPQAYCHEERNWYRGLTVLDQNVVPVVNPLGFLSPEELMLLDLIMGETGVATAAPQPESSFGLNS
jgi:chemotaxis signal transduction protein